MLLVVISPFSFMILLIWVYYVFFFKRLTNDLSILLILSKNQLLALFICSTLLLVSIILSSAPIFINSLLLLCVGSICCFFSSSFRCKVRFCISVLSSFWMDTCIVMYFSLRTACCVSQRFWTVVYSFSLFSMKLYNSSLISCLTFSSFSRMFLNLHVIKILLNYFLWFSSNFKALWSENTQGTIPIFWYWLRPDLWPSMWSILEKVPCALEKNVYSVEFGCKVL